VPLQAALSPPPQQSAAVEQLLPSGRQHWPPVQGKPAQQSAVPTHVLPAGSQHVEPLQVPLQQLLLLVLQADWSALQQ
jgi:hypothetical protein